MAIETPRHTAPEIWLSQIFSAKAVSRGGVIRRSTALVEREVGRTRFTREVARRGFTLLEGGGQFVVICNPHPIRVVTSGPLGRPATERTSRPTRITLK